METVTALGLAGNILQFIEFGGQVVIRLQEFCSNARDVPQTFREVKNSLPLLLNSLKHIRQDLENGEVDQETEAALLPVIQGCTEQIESLNQILEGTLPAPGDSQWKAVTKALTSFWHDKKIQNIRTTINHYQGPLLLYQTRRSRTSDATLEHQRLSSLSEDSPYLDKGTVVLPSDRTPEQVIPCSLVMTPTSPTSSFGSPTEKIFESGWSMRTGSTAGTALTSPNPAASEPEPRQRQPTAVQKPSNDTPLMLTEPAIDPLQRAIEAKM
jgi:N-terminal domain on NACHT_NTPase and P-loop NTPases